MRPEASRRPNVAGPIAHAAGSNRGPAPRARTGRTDLDVARDDVAAATRALAGRAGELRELAARARRGGFVGTAVLDGIARYEAAAAVAAAAQGRLRELTSALRVAPPFVPEPRTDAAGVQETGPRLLEAAVTASMAPPLRDEAGVEGRAWP
jgi:hypothetical protein